MDGVFDLGFDGASLVDGVSDDVHDPAEGLGADGDTDGSPGVINFLAPDEPFGGIHSDGSNSGISQVLGHLKY